MIAHSTPTTPVARLGRVHDRRQFTLVSMFSALIMLMLSLACFAHASSSPTAAAHASIHSTSPPADTDAGRSPLPLSIPPTTPIKLRTSDGQVFDTTAATVARSSVITALLTDVSHTAIISLPANITAASMTRVLTWLDHHQGTGLLPSYNPIGTPWPLPAVSDWDQAFLDSLDNEALISVMLAADHLNLKPLMYMATGQVARMIAGKTSKEIANMFNIEDELTPEEEEAIRRENEWPSHEL